MNLKSIALILSLTAPIWLVTPTFAQDVMTVSSGDFRNADEVHRGSGVASISKIATGDYVLNLSSFSTTPGPDLEVWLVKASGITSAEQVLASDYLSLGALQSPDGDQSYMVPAGMSVEGYSSVVIWCKSFSVLFSAADLTASAM